MVVACRYSTHHIKAESVPKSTQDVKYMKVNIAEQAHKTANCSTITDKTTQVEVNNFVHISIKKPDKPFKDFMGLPYSGGFSLRKVENYKLFASIGTHFLYVAPYLYFGDWCRTSSLSSG